MRPKLSSAMRAQTQTLVRSRLEAMPSLVKTKAQDGVLAPAPEQDHARAAAGFAGTRLPKLSVWVRTGLADLAKLWRWFLIKRQIQVSSKRLRVVETASLGEKRFVAVLHVDGAQFLIGGGANSVSLLASLESASGASASGESRFAKILQQTAQDGSAAH